MLRQIIFQRIKSQTSHQRTTATKRYESRQVKVGDNLKAMTSKVTAVDGEKVTGEQLFGGRKVVLFGLPGAFTPVCSNKHVPAFIQQAETLKERGIDHLACLSVNDRFVMDAWGSHLNVGDAVEMLADPDASFVSELGLEVDLAAAGFGVRAKRFALLVDDGRVDQVFVEDSPA